MPLVWIVAPWLRAAWFIAPLQVGDGGMLPPDRHHIATLKRMLSHRPRL